VPVETVRNMVVHAIIARSTASNMEAVITAVRLSLIEPPSYRVRIAAWAGASSATLPWSCSGLRPPSHAPV
jgi:hypothetical protein